MKADPKTGLPLARMPRGKLPHFELCVRQPNGTRLGIVAPYTETGLSSLRRYLDGIADKSGTVNNPPRICPECGSGCSPTCAELDALTR